MSIYHTCYECEYFNWLQSAEWRNIDLLELANANILRISIVLEVIVN